MRVSPQCCLGSCDRRAVRICSPIEIAFSKIKQFLSPLACRTVDALLWNVMQDVLDAVPPTDAPTVNDTRGTTLHDQKSPIDHPWLIVQANAITQCTVAPVDAMLSAQAQRKWIRNSFDINDRHCT